MSTGRQQQLFLQDTYRTEVATIIIDHGVTDDRVWVSPRENIFHPQGGGQPADAGLMNGVVVHPVWSRTTEGRVDLVLSDGAERDAIDLQDGARIELVVEAEGRLRYAALHTAGHILDAAIRRRGYRHLVSNHFPDEARIEFSADGRTEDLDVLAQEVQKEVEEAIAAAAVVTTSTDGEGRRVVQIGEVSTDVCGGTHLRTSAEITAFSVRSVKVKKGRLKVGYTAEHLHG